MIRDDRDSGKPGLDEAAIEEMVSPRLYDYYTWATKGSKFLALGYAPLLVLSAVTALHSRVEIHSGRSPLDSGAKCNRTMQTGFARPSCQRHARFALMGNERRPCAATNDEVTLPVATLGSGVDRLGPFVDGDAILMVSGEGLDRRGRRRLCRRAR